MDFLDTAEPKAACSQASNVTESGINGQKHTQRFSIAWIEEYGQGK